MSEQNSYKNFLINLLGAFILVFGMTLVLVWWESVVDLFKGGVGMLLAVAGLLVLYVRNNK